MHMTPEIGIAISAGTMTLAGAVTSLTEGGKQLSALGVAGLSCVVMIACVIAMVRIYKDKQIEAHELVDLIKTNTRSIVAQTEVNRTNTGVLVEVKDALVGQVAVMKNLKCIHDL